MTEDLTDYRAQLHGNPLADDPGASARRQWLKQRGLTRTGALELDAFAADMAQGVARLTGGRPPNTMVNLFFDQDEEPVQYFAGLYDPSGEMKRDMLLDEGFCAHVVKRGSALVLDDVCDYPRFCTNPALDKFNVRSYFGAPVIDEGTVIGTVCAVDTEVREYGRDGLRFIKGRAAEVRDLLKGPLTSVSHVAGPA